MKVFDQTSKPDGLKQCRKTATCSAVQIDEPFRVETMEGVMEGKAGDYLMEGVQGELYVCDQSVFDESYAFIGLGDPDDEPYLDIKRVGWHLAFEGQRIPIHDVESWSRKLNVVTVWVQSEQHEHMNSVKQAYNLISDARRAVKLIDEAMSADSLPSMEDKEPKTAARMAEDLRGHFGSIVAGGISAASDPMMPLTIEFDIDGLERGVQSEIVEHLMHHYDWVLREEGVLYAGDYDAFTFHQHALREMVE